jgi:hypothetical protein
LAVRYCSCPNVGIRHRTIAQSMIKSGSAEDEGHPSRKSFLR